MFNKVILVGNLTRDIELRYSQNGSAIAKSAIATSRKFTVNGERREEVCFIDITFFGRSGEIANQYLRKGSKILVEGRLIFEQWVDQNGAKRSKHSVTVENMQMLDSRADAQTATMAPQQGGGYGNYNQQAQPYGGGSGMQQPQNGGYNNQQSNPYTAPATPSYEQPQPSVTPKEMPSNDAIPEIDIDEDEIPF
ncbi:Single-stranded DNA-binding protein [hydrothermal vent metagenome]|uniref:Single-stranded DNA-binding protein n=1 Tax=hydrothermal vent metagenome TaxID=652676 RepID=A0A1W1BY64_9ZZZZ